LSNCAAFGQGNGSRSSLCGLDESLFGNLDCNGHGVARRRRRRRRGRGWLAESESSCGLGREPQATKPPQIGRNPPLGASPRRHRADADAAGPADSLARSPRRPQSLAACPPWPRRRRRTQRTQKFCACGGNTKTGGARRAVCDSPAGLARRCLSLLRLAARRWWAIFCARWRKRASSGGPDRHFHLRQGYGGQVVAPA
jgi:hypothetical protein